VAKAISSALVWRVGCRPWTAALNAASYRAKLSNVGHKIALEEMAATWAHFLATRVKSCRMAFAGSGRRQLQIFPAARLRENSRLSFRGRRIWRDSLAWAKSGKLAEVRELADNRPQKLAFLTDT